MKAYSQTADLPIISENLIFNEEKGLVAVEAEHFCKQSANSLRRWYINSAKQKPQVRPDLDEAPFDDASNKAYLEVLPDNFVTLDDPIIEEENLGLKPGHTAVVYYKIHFENAGRYYVWTRMRSNDGEDNTCHVGIDGKWTKSGMILQFPKDQKKWFWNNKIRNKVPQPDGNGVLACIDVPVAGVHEVMFSMREDGFEFDKFILTQDSTYKKLEGEGIAAKVFQGKLPNENGIAPPPKTLWNPDGVIYGANVFYGDINGKITFEAENFYKQTKTTNRMWHLVTSKFYKPVGPDSDSLHLAGASDEAYLELLPDGRQKDEDEKNNKSSIFDKPDQGAVLHYAINFSQAGKYYVWVRGYGVDGDDNTLHVGIDSLAPESGKRLHINKLNKWEWICNQRNTKQKIWVDVPTKGIHFLTLSMREDGCEIDKILLTTDESYVPSSTDTTKTFVKKGKLDDWLANREKWMTPQLTYQESNGTIVIEAENIASTKGWLYSVDTTKHLGLGYLTWKKQGQGIQAGQGLLSYDFEIKTAGNYQFFMRSRMLNPSNRPETLDPDGNDIWLKFEGGTDVNKAKRLGNEWNKIAILGHPQGRTYNTHAVKGKPHPNTPVCRYFEAGKYKIMLSGRSEGHCIDRLILKKYNKKTIENLSFDEETELDKQIESLKQ